MIDRVREDGVERVRVCFVDYNGLVRARSVAVTQLESAFDRGINFSSPTVDFDSRDLFPPGAAFDLASPDFWAVPDPSTYRPAPGASGTGEMLADLVDAAGDAWSGCPRSALRRVVGRAADAGVAFHVGFEPEGYIVRDVESEPMLVGRPQFATLDGLDLQSDFMHDVLTYLREAGIETPQWSEEYGPGQIEINLRHARPVEAADALVAFKSAFRALARRHGLVGTFMPKPFEDQAGSGLHVHLSATPVDDPDTNLFDDTADSELGLSDLGRHALAGLLEHGEAVMAMGASTVNSYKRFRAGSWAPTHVMYAYASRAAFVRVPERETARRIELRVGDPACNPHLYLTAVLAAALDGIERRLSPGAPVPGDVGAMGAVAEQRGARPVPRTLERALDALARDEVVGGALGRLITGEYVAIKRSEWDAFAEHVGQWDRDWYLRRY